MVNLRRESLVLLVSFLVGGVGFGQGPTPGARTARADIYANFVGTWVGNTRVLRGGDEQTTPIKIEVTEDANKTHLRFFFTFKEQGIEGFVHIARVATFDPVKGEMTWVATDRPEAPDALRHTVGLDDFARNGYGVFDASYEYGSGSHHLVGRCRYVLDPNLFGYVWYQSVDGKPFTKYSVTELTRETAAMAVLSEP